MHILISTGLYPPEIGGPATYTVLLEKELPKYGHTVSVLAFAPSRVYPRGIRHLHFCLRLIRAGRRADLFFAQDVSSVGLPTLLIARVLRKKFIVRVPGDYAWEQSVQRYGVTESIDDFQTKTYSMRVRFLRLVQEITTKYADRVITPSNYFKTLVTGWGVPSEKITTIYNGIHVHVTPLPVTKPSSLTIVTAGRLVPWKGFSELIILMQKMPVWHLVILGDGPMMNALKQLAYEKKVADRVHFVGSVSREAVFGWLQVADAFVLNTHFESFSYQVVEAMSAGIPTITTTVGSLPELITNEKEGLLLAPNDMDGFAEAIKTVVNNKDVWRQRSYKAIAKAEQFSIETTTKALVQVLYEYET